jgi:hypothetical protein
VSADHADDLPAQYDPNVVGHAILLAVFASHPERLTVDELVGRVASRRDEREVETAAAVLRELRASGLVRYSDDDQLVEPTQAALHARALFSAA